MERDYENDVKREFREWWEASGQKIEVLDIPNSYFTAAALEGLKPICEARVMTRLRRRKLA